MTDHFTLPDTLFERGYRLFLPTEDRLNALEQHANPRDVAEVLATTGWSFKRALRISVESSPSPYMILGPRRQVLAAIGVSQGSVLDDEGIPWMLGTDEVPQHRKALLKASKAWVEYQKPLYSALRNVVPADYPEAIRWLKWLGFDILPAEPLGNAGAMLHKVQWVKEGP
jgi:hypothetical protein